jgi:hypothetical protein
MWFIFYIENTQMDMCGVTDNDRIIQGFQIY